MSDPVRVALVGEGPTDGVVIEAALRSMLQERSFILQQIFPEGSVSFGELGSGWVGVYRWCHQSARRGGGRLQNDALVFENYDVLVLHLDADVARSTYNQGSITPDANDGVLPCERDCPPPADTTNALRTVLLSWCGETAATIRTVICMPSKSMEAWVIAALFPNDQAMLRGIECYPNPEGRLGQQPTARRIRKRKRDYELHVKEIETAWPGLASPHALGEAWRFQLEFLAALPQQGL
jgi:hypothetical protein